MGDLDSCFFFHFFLLFSLFFLIINDFFIDQNQPKEIVYKVCALYKHHNSNKSELLKVPTLAESIIFGIYNSFCMILVSWI